MTFVIEPSAARLRKASGYELSPRSGMVSLDIAPGTLPAVPGGVDDHHITIVYLGKDVDDTLLAKVLDVVREIASSTPPLSGTLGGRGTFAPSDASDGKTPVFVKPDIPGIEALRPPLQQFNASQFTDFKPHATLAYVEKGDKLPDPVEPTPVTFDHLTVHRGLDVFHVPLTGGVRRPWGRDLRPGGEPWPAEVNGVKTLVHGGNNGEVTKRISGTKGFYQHHGQNVGTIDPDHNHANLYIAQSSHGGMMKSSEHSLALSWLKERNRMLHRVEADMLRSRDWKPSATGGVVTAPPLVDFPLQTRDWTHWNNEHRPYGRGHYDKRGMTEEAEAWTRGHHEVHSETAFYKATHKNAIVSPEEHAKHARKEVAKSFGKPLTKLSPRERRITQAYHEGRAHAHHDLAKNQKFLLHAVGHTMAMMSVEPGSLDVRNWAQWHLEHPYIKKGHSLHEGSEVTHHEHAPTPTTKELPIPKSPDGVPDKKLAQYTEEAKGAHQFASGSTRANRFEAGYVTARSRAHVDNLSPEEAHTLSTQHDTIARGLQANQAQAKREGVAAGYHAHSIGHGDKAAPEPGGHESITGIQAFDPALHEKVKAKDIKPGDLIATHQDGKLYPAGASTAAGFKPTATTEKGYVAQHNAATYGGKQTFQRVVSVETDKQGSRIHLAGGDTRRLGGGNATVYARLKTTVEPGPTHPPNDTPFTNKRQADAYKAAHAKHSEIAKEQGMDAQQANRAADRAFMKTAPEGTPGRQQPWHAAAKGEEDAYRAHAKAVETAPPPPEEGASIPGTVREGGVSKTDAKTGITYTYHEDNKGFSNHSVLVQAHKNGTLLGDTTAHPQYGYKNINGPTVSVWKYQVADSQRRQGIARKMVESIHENNPDAKVLHSGFVSDEGEKFAESMDPKWNRVMTFNESGFRRPKGAAAAPDHHQTGYDAAKNGDARIVPRSVLVDHGADAAKKWYAGYDKRRSEEAEATIKPPSSTAAKDAHGEAVKEGDRVRRVGAVGHEGTVSRISTGGGAFSNGGRPMVRVQWDNGASSAHTDATLEKIAPKPPVIEPGPTPTGGTTPADASKYLKGSPKYKAFNAGHARASTVLAENPDAAPGVSKILADDHEANAKQMPAGVERADTEGMAAAYRKHAESGAVTPPPKPPRPDYEAERQVKRDAKNLAVGDRVNVTHAGKDKVGVIKQATKTRVLVTVPMTTSKSGATERDVWRDKLEVTKRGGLKPPPVVEPGPTASESHHLAGNLNIGQVVEHPAYGKGRITQLGKDRATVDFNQHGAKSFGASFANHEPKFVEGTAPVHVPNPVEKPIPFTVDHSLDGTKKPNVVTATTTKRAYELAVGERLANQDTPIKSIETGTRRGWSKLTMEDGKVAQVKRTENVTIYPKPVEGGSGEMLPALSSEKLIEDLKPGDKVQRRYGNPIETHVGTVKGTKGEGRGRNRQFRVEYEEGDMMPSYHSKGTEMTVLPPEGAMRQSTPADKTVLVPGTQEWKAYNGGHAEALGFHQKQRFTAASGQHALNEAVNDLERTPAPPAEGSTSPDFYASRRGRHAGYIAGIKEVLAGEHGGLETRQLADLKPGDTVGKNAFGNDISVTHAQTAVTRTTVKLTSKDDKGGDIETEHTMLGDASASLLAEAHQTERMRAIQREANAKRIKAELDQKQAIREGSPATPISEADKTEGKRQLAHILLRSKTNETERDAANSDEEYHRRGYATPGEAADEAITRSAAMPSSWDVGANWLAQTRKALMESHSVDEFHGKAPGVEMESPGPSSFRKRTQAMKQMDRQLGQAQAHEANRVTATANNAVIDKLAEAIATGGANPAAAGSLSESTIQSMRRQVELKMNGEEDHVSDVRGLAPNDFARHAAVMAMGNEIAARIDARSDVRAALSQERETRGAEGRMPPSLPYASVGPEATAYRDREAIRSQLRTERARIVGNAKKVLHDATMEELLKEPAYDRTGREDAITGHKLIGTSKAVEDLAHSQMRHYPTQWIKNSGAGRTLTVRETKGRAHYQEASHTTQALEKKGATGLVATMTAGKTQKSVALHELGHRMEDTNPGLGALEAAHIETRAVGEGVRHLGSGYGRGEGSKFDQFMSPYAGKLYTNAQGYHEVFTMGMQGILGEDESTSTYGRLVGIDGAKADPRLRRFVLGALAIHANPSIQTTTTAPTHA